MALATGRACRSPGGALAAIILVLAGFKQLLNPSTALILGVLAAAGLAVVVKHRLSGVCAAITFVVLLFGVYYLQPAYNRQFAFRSQLRTDAVLADTEGLPVACYPQRWDSVSFYLPHADVRVYSHEQRRHLLRDLIVQPRTLLLVKSGKAA